MTENDKSKVPEKSAITEGGRDTTLESSKLDSQAEPGTLQHVQSMKLLDNYDSRSAEGNGIRVTFKRLLPFLVGTRHLQRLIRLRKK